MKRVNLTGKQFGRLTAVAFNHIGKDGHAHWNCQCSCGKKVIVGINNLQRAGGTRSCGCLKLIYYGGSSLKHGETKGDGWTKEYGAWAGMKDRCYRKSNKSFPNYGGRGIRVCDRWFHSFENFLADIGRAPSPEHSIDRINNDGNYEPSNCRWATRSQQRRNQRPQTKSKGSRS